MTDIDSIETFKRSIEEELDAFIKNRGDEIGDPAGWKVGRIVLTPAPHCLYLSRLEDGKFISFVLHDIPEDLTPEERLDLRHHINQICETRGFHPYIPRKTPLSSNIMDAARRGESEAWNRFVSFHFDRTERYAEKMMRHNGTSSILGSEDVTNMAFANAHKRAGEGDTTENNLELLLFNNLQNALRYANIQKRRRESDGRDFKHVPQPEYDDGLERLEEQLPKILDAAREKMSQGEMPIFDAIVRHYTLGGNVITNAQIAKILATKEDGTIDKKSS